MGGESAQTLTEHLRRISDKWPAEPVWRPGHLLTGSSNGVRLRRRATSHPRPTNNAEQAAAELEAAE